MFNLKVKSIKPARRYWEHARYDINVQPNPTSNIPANLQSEPPNTVQRDPSSSSTRGSSLCRTASNATFLTEPERGTGCRLHVESISPSTKYWQHARYKIQMEPTDARASTETILHETEEVGLVSERRGSLKKIQSHTSSEIGSATTVGSIRKSENSLRKNIALRRSPSLEALENATAMMQQLSIAINVPIEDDEEINPFPRFMELPYE